MKRIFAVVLAISVLAAVPACAQQFPPLGDDNNVIHALGGDDYVQTGAGNDHVLLVYGHGVVRCDGPGHKTIVLPKLPKNRHYQLIGCSDKTIVPFAV